MTTQPEFDGPRLMRWEEEPASARLFRMCFMGEEDTLEPTSPLLPDEPPARGRRHDEAETYLFASQGRPVSQISTFIERLQTFNGIIRTGCIGGVCTHPAYRGYGLASRLLEHCAGRLKQRGARLMLISGGRGLYTRAGCTPAGRYASFVLNAGQEKPPDPDVSLRPLNRSDARTASFLYQSTAVRFERRLDTFTSGLGRQPGNYQAEQWMVELDRKPAAYLMLNIPWDFVHQTEPAVRELYEYAGSRVALAAGLEAALRQPGISEVHIHVPWQDADLIHLLAQSAGQPAWTTLPDHTMYILDFPRLMADLRRYLRARLEPALLRGLHFEQSGPLLGTDGGNLLTIARGKERLTLDGTAMTRLVMGSADDPGPVELPRSGAFKEIVEALFPLPSFLPGLNYH